MILHSGWISFLPGRAPLSSNWTPSPDTQLFTDTLGSNGWGAFWNGNWLQTRWTPQQSKMPILWKELFAIVCAVHTWRQCWRKQKILFHCDNFSVVDIWQKGSTSDAETISLCACCISEQHITILIL